MNRRSFRNFFHAHGLAALGLLLVLTFNLAVRWHLREMPLERDEGEYAYAGQLLLQGIPPYQLAYNMKFPGVYFAYAALMKCFGESPQGIHFGIILVTSASAILVFLIGCELLGAMGGLMTAATFVCLSALPTASGLAGHATHFVTLFVCAGTFALLKAERKTPLFWPLMSGIAFGLAVLMKQHAVFFLPMASGWLAWQLFRQKKSVLRIGLFFAGFAIPLLLTAAMLAYAGVWDRFYFWTIQYARRYVSMLPLSVAPEQFIMGFKPVFDSGVWVWIFGVGGLSLVFLKREFRRAAVISAGLFLTGMAAACPGFYFRGHYLLMAMPGLALLNAALILAFADKLKKIPQVRLVKLLPAVLFCIVAGDLVVRNFGTWFLLTPNEVSRTLYGSNPFPESAGIANYLAAHTSPDETITVLGSEPQIYFLARRHSASGYIYLYPLTEPQPLAARMQKEFISEIETARPRYVVFVNIAFVLAFRHLSRQTPSEHPILNWWDSYSQNYEPAGGWMCLKTNPRSFSGTGSWQTAQTHRRQKFPSSAENKTVYSHSIVPGGLLVMSKTQRFTPFTSLMMRLASFSSRS